VAAFTVLLFASLDAQAQDVGILKGRDGCPPGSSEVTWVMDNEDSHSTSSVSGWIGASQMGESGNLILRFCKIPASLLANAPGPFAVLALGTCPASTWVITRNFDIENNHPKSRFEPSEAAASPNFMTGNIATIYFCVYQGVSGGSFPDLKREYGVFADQYTVPGAFEFGQMHSDDEDDTDATCCNWNDWRWPRNWTQFIHPPHQIEGVSCCINGLKLYKSDGTWFWSWTWDPQLSFLYGWGDTTFSIARVGNTVPRPQAVCTASPNTGTDSIYTAFDGRQSFARGGKYLVSYEWTFPSGSTSNDPGPHYMSYVVAPGNPQEFTATLKVTDNGGEVSYASCSVFVNSSQQCSGTGCEIE
jgi:hypothetical protein